jgi:hypothetical protein
MITQRRVFQAKPGAATAVVVKMKEFQPIFEKHGGSATRIYTDLYSGHTDRVVWEYDVESLSELESFEQVLKKADVVKAFADWYKGLVPLIEGATVELWSRA